MSPKFPIGVAIIERPLVLLFIFNLFIISCTPANLSKQVPKNIQEDTIAEKPVVIKSKKKMFQEKENKDNKIINKVAPLSTIIVLFAKDDDKKTIKQFLNIYELGIYNLGVKDVSLQIEFFESDEKLKNIIEDNLLPGRIFLGPIQSSTQII